MAPMFGWIKNPPRPQWEYRTEDEGRADLASLGRDGWELVGVGHRLMGEDRQLRILYFKRRAT